MYTLYKSREDIAVILPFVDELEVGVVSWIKFIGMLSRILSCNRDIQSRISRSFA